MNSREQIPGADLFRAARAASLAGAEQPATWITAVSVHQVDEAVRTATQAGGTAPGQSIDIPTLGRFHRLEDPAGAEIDIKKPSRTAPQPASTSPAHGR